MTSALSIASRSAEGRGRHAAALLLVVSFSLAGCGSREPAPSSTPGAAQSTSAATVAWEPAPPTASSPAPPLTNDVPQPPAPAPATEAPPYTGPIPGTCSAIEAEIGRTFADKSCQSESDCDHAAAYCTCPSAIAKRARAKLDALNQAFSDKECFRKGPPRPCATCAPPPPPKCSGGTCS